MCGVVRMREDVCLTESPTLVLWAMSAKQSQSAHLVSRHRHACTHLFTKPVSAHDTHAFIKRKTRRKNKRTTILFENHVSGSSSFLSFREVPRNKGSRFSLSKKTNSTFNELPQEGGRLKPNRDPLNSDTFDPQAF